MSNRLPKMIRKFLRPSSWHLSALLFLLISLMMTYTNCAHVKEKKNNVRSRSFSSEDERKDGQQQKSFPYDRVRSLNAFSKKVYPLIKNNCTGCHQNQKEQGSAPHFAQADAAALHDEILNERKVNFADIPHSRLVQKLQKQQHSCWGDCQQNAQEMEMALQDWYYQIGEDGGFSFDQMQMISGEIPLLQQNKKQNQDQVGDRAQNKLAPKMVSLGTLKIDLTDSLNLANAQGENVRLLFDVFDRDRYSYELRNLRLETEKKNIEVKNIKALVNKIFNPQNDLYAQVDEVIAPPGGILSQAALIILKDENATIDKISFAFARLQVTQRIREQKNSL